MAVTIKCDECGYIMTVPDVTSKATETANLQNVQIKNQAEMQKVLDTQKYLVQQMKAEFEKVKLALIEATKYETVTKLNLESTAKVVLADGAVLAKKTAKPGIIGPDF